MENRINIPSLILKHLHRTISDAERQLLEQWLNESSAHRQRFNELTNFETLQKKVVSWQHAGGDMEMAWVKLISQLEAPEQVIIRRIPMIRKYWQIAAAVAVVAFGITFYLIQSKSKSSTGSKGPESQMAVQTDVQPGGNKAILELADGKIIAMDDANDGTVAKQGAAQVIKKEGVISYVGGISKPGLSVLYNKLTVPKGGQYQLVLQDGTKVWLNAESSIRYPTVFNGKDRTVEITGEAYFEVAPSISPQGGVKKGFHVRTGDLNVSVLGTHFNVMAYAEEGANEITLLEGAVQVSRSGAVAFLKPGQQAVAKVKSEEKMEVKRTVDTEEVMAWKNGKFRFNDEELAAVLRQIARWYDVNVVYEGNVPQIRLNGEAKRNLSLSNLLKMLELSDVKFRIEGKKLIVPEQQ